MKQLIPPEDQEYKESIESMSNSSPSSSASNNLTMLRSQDPTSTTRSTCQDHQAPPQRDAFLFYSNPENLRRAWRFEPPVQSNTEDASSNSQVIKRKTRISFERDPLSLMMDDEAFLEEFQSIEGADVDLLSLLPLLAE